MYRPKGWENPYAKKGNTDENYDSLMFEIFEAGADAMLKALRQNAIHFESPSPYDPQWVRSPGTIVCIPDDE